jgi:Bifunctional DNA primase/polymerase, N-terminal/Primase C terminal 1 (PriCT-1)
MSMLGSALAFARRGNPVLPLTWPIEQDGRLQCSCGGDSRGQPCRTPAKHPHGLLAPDGLLSATTEAGIIKHWFGYRAPAANLGVRTDLLVVLDADPRHGGDETLAALEHANPFPKTWRVLTGGGGEHVIFKCPANIIIGSSNATGPAANPVLGAGIDVRAQGGYIVAPPSRHISGRSYTWSVDHHPADIPLAEAPAWLIERLAVTAQAASNGHDPQEWAAAKAGMISEYRDMAIASVAGKLLRAISLDPRFVATLIHDWNECHCQPPLPEDEVAAIIKRIAKREIQRLRAEAQHA